MFIVMLNNIIIILCFLNFIFYNTSVLTTVLNIPNNII